MSRIRAVIDTNILVSAVIATRPTSVPAQILQAIIDNKVQLVTTESLLIELADVLSRKHIVRLHRRDATQIQQLVAALAQISSIVLVDDIPPISDDLDDDVLFACALMGNASLIITGDKKHVLSIGEYKGIRVISAQQFVQML